jgi:hypothetical protein
MFKASFGPSTACSGRPCLESWVNRSSAGRIVMFADVLVPRSGGRCRSSRPHRGGVHSRPRSGQQRGAARRAVQAIEWTRVTIWRIPTGHCCGVQCLGAASRSPYMAAKPTGPRAAGQTWAEAELGRSMGGVIGHPEEAHGLLASTHTEDVGGFRKRANQPFDRDVF